MLVDAHCHLDDYESELEMAVASIQMNRILSISTSMDFFSYQRVLSIAQDCPFVIPAFGVHPWNAAHYWKNLTHLAKFIQDAPLIGEIGMDFHFIDDVEVYPKQERIFEFFLKGAREFGKIVNVHTKGAEKEVLHLMDRLRIEKAIIHWYSGPMDTFREFVSRGYYFTVGVSALYSREIQKFTREIPEDRLLTGTDNSGASMWLKNEIGMPMLIMDVVDKIGEIRSMDRDAVIHLVMKNLRELFSGDDRLSGILERFS